MPDVALEELIAKAARIYADLRKLSAESEKSVEELLLIQNSRASKRQQQQPPRIEPLRSVE